MPGRVSAGLAAADELLNRKHEGGLHEAAKTPKQKRRWVTGRGSLPRKARAGFSCGPADDVVLDAFIQALRRCDTANYLSRRPNCVTGKNHYANPKRAAITSLNSGIGGR